MFCITVRLPFAAAISAGRKLVENRGKPIPPKYLGQPVAIHAAAAWSKEGGADRRIHDWWWGAGRHPDWVVDATDFTGLFRKVIAVATVADCHRAEWPLNEALTCCMPWGDRRYGPRQEAAWHIVLADVIALDEPVGPVRGSLLVPWKLPSDVAEQVRMQIEVTS